MVQAFQATTNGPMVAQTSQQEWWVEQNSQLTARRKEKEDRWPHHPLHAVT